MAAYNYHFALRLQYRCFVNDSFNKTVKRQL